ncbi:MAG: purine-nucleoside phosphorylase, partial [bacterium]
TNAAGGVHRHLKTGSLMLIEDQVDLQLRRRVRSVARGAMELEREAIFQVGLSYSERLLELAETAAQHEGIRVSRGVLGALTGPSYETPAEVRIWLKIGVDAASMSTVAESTEGALLGMEVLGISCITNRAAGLSGTPLHHSEVIEVARQVRGDFKRLLRAIIQRI